MTIQRFALAGMVSGAISGVATMMPRPAALIVPPLAFGIALAAARRSRSGSSVLFYLAITLAWFATLVIGLVSTRLNGVPPSGIWPFVVVLITGPVLFVLAYCLSFRPYASEVFLVVVTPTAAVLALIGLGVNEISRSVLMLPSPIGFTVSLMIWQTGVAAAVGLSERTSRFMSEEDENREHTRASDRDLAQSGPETARSSSIERSAS